MARGQGEGTITYMEDKKLYCGRLTVGYDANGKQKRKAFYGKTKKEVQEKMNAAKAELDKGIFVDSAKMTVGDWLDIWLLEYKKRSVKNNTYRILHEKVNRFIKPAFGKLKLKDLRGDVIQKLINEMSDKGYSYSTISKTYETMYGALQQAINNDLIFKNVATTVILPKKEKKEIRVLTNEEQDKFMAIAKSLPPYGFVFILVLGTGLRIGETLALEWSDIDFENGLLSVNKTIALFKDCDDPDSKAKYLLGTPKTQSSNRTVPLLPDLLNMLKEIKAESINNLVFPGPTGGHAHPQTIRYHFKKQLMIADIPRIDEIHMHSLRHTFATRGLEQGIELKVMQEFLGHASIQETADTYTHVLPDKKKDSIMKLQETMKI